MSSLKITSEWIDSDEAFRPEIDQSYGNLGMSVAGTWLTEYETESGARANRIEVPSYPIAEWFAENWWSLLYEPEKGEHSRRDPRFRARHWLGTAREGFVLPDGWINSLGKGLVRVHADPYFFPHSRLVLRNSADERFRVEDVERELSSFVEAVIARLDSKGVTDTNLHAIWSAFRGMNADERRYCQLLGALGLSPYDTPPDIGDLLTGILGARSEQLTEDFCDAADEGDIFDAAGDMVKTLDALESEPEIDLAHLFRLRNQGSHTPKRLALNAVRAVREQFGIDTDDPQGGEAFLSDLGLNRIIYDQDGFRDIDEPVLHGSLRRRNNIGQINLIRKHVPARRFDAARACYIAWSQTVDGDRLVTRARVPDQQASRIFAAELLAPIDFIRARTRNNLLSQYGAAELANELNVSSAVVTLQASHNRINVVGQSAGNWG